MSVEPDGTMRRLAWCLAACLVACGEGRAFEDDPYTAGRWADSLVDDFTLESSTMLDIVADHGEALRDYGDGVDARGAQVYRMDSTEAKLDACLVDAAWQARQALHAHDMREALDRRNIGLERFRAEFADWEAGWRSHIDCWRSLWDDPEFADYRSLHAAQSDSLAAEDRAKYAMQARKRAQAAAAKRDSIAAATAERAAERRARYARQRAEAEARQRAVREKAQAARAARMDCDRRLSGLRLAPIDVLADGAWRQVASMDGRDLFVIRGGHRPGHERRIDVQPGAPSWVRSVPGSPHAQRMLTRSQNLARTMNPRTVRAVASQLFCDINGNR